MYNSVPLDTEPILELLAVLLATGDSEHAALKKQLRFALDEAQLPGSTLSAESTRIAWCVSHGGVVYVALLLLTKNDETAATPQRDAL